MEYSSWDTFNGTSRAENDNIVDHDDAKNRRLPIANNGSCWTTCLCLYYLGSRPIA